jgi:CBS domain-containing protein
VLVRELMTQPVHVVTPDASLEAAARSMLDHEVAALPVVDETGRMIGILTTSDFTAKGAGIPFSVFEAPQVLGRWLGREGLESIYEAARTRQVGEVMTRTPLTVPDTATVDEAVRVMLSGQVHHVVAVREGRPVGMVSRRDLLRLLLRS